MHLVLDSCEEVLGHFAVQGIVYSGCVDIGDLLIETAFTGTDLLNFRNQVIKIGFIKNLTVG